MAETDIELIEKIKNENCNQSLLTLIQRHSALCLSIFQKYSSCFARNPQKFNDLICEKDMLIYRSALSFNKDKGAKFVTWLGNHARYECLNALNDKNREDAMDSSSVNYYADKEENSSEKLDADVDFVFTILGSLNDNRIKEVFTLRYFTENKHPSWSVIGEKLNISTQTAINLHNRGRKVLMKKLKSKECFDKI